MISVRTFILMKCMFSYLRNDRKIKFRMLSVQHFINEATEPSTLVKLFSLRQQEQSEHVPLSSHHYLYGAIFQSRLCQGNFTVLNREIVHQNCVLFSSVQTEPAA